MDIQPPKHPTPDLPQGIASGPLPAPTPPGSLPAPDSPKQRLRWPGSWRSVVSTVLLFGSALGLAFLIATYGIQSYQVDGPSMETTLQNNDRLIVDKIPRTWSRITGHPYLPNRGDIVIFNQTGLFGSSDIAEKRLIKRVIGLPGDRVVVRNGTITIYNQQYPDGFNPDEIVGYTIDAKTTPGEVDLKILPGEIFLCGDNRTNSEDSRYFGPVKANHVVGKLILRIIPLGKAGRF